MTRRLLLALAVALALLTACRPQAPEASGPDGIRTTAGGTAAAPQVTKLLVFIVENHSMAQMQDGMPWVARLADRYGYTTRYHAITHPSLPNYLAIAGGSTFGITDDQPPAAHPVRRPSVFGQAIAAGATATTYAEGMPGTCHLTNSGRYAVRHNPWTYFRAERADCRVHDVSLDQLSGDVAAGALPAVGMVVPDTCNDAHDCSLKRANAWMRSHVGEVLDGPDFASGQLAVVITADEDDNHHGNSVLTVVAHPDLQHRVVTRRLDHYSLSRSYAEVGGFTPLGHAAGARSLLGAFGLTTGS